MTKLVWDQIGNRVFEAGVDRGVIYLPNGSAVSWSGLISVEERFDGNSVPYYLDGTKYLDQEIAGNFSANISAFTYPEEFEELIGSGSYSSGLQIRDQKPRIFNLAYRTKIGNDVDGVDHGYKIHIIYNVVAISDDVLYETLNDNIRPVDFGWILQTTPEQASGIRPTAHIVLDSTRLAQGLLQKIEDILYGTSTTDPYLPPLSELMDIALSWAIVITDHGDGTWSATAPDETDHIRMLSETMFEISDVDAVFLDEDTYEVSTTPLR